MNNTTDKVKILCLHANEDSEIIQKLGKHLTALNQNIDFNLLSDDNSNSEQSENGNNNELESYHIFLLAISVDFITSSINTGIEMQKIMQQHEERKSFVLPIILSSCNWFIFPYGKLQALPINATPVNDRSWNSVDDALLKVIAGIEQVIIHINKG